MAETVWIWHFWSRLHLRCTHNLLRDLAAELSTVAGYAEGWGEVADASRDGIPDPGLMGFSMHFAAAAQRWEIGG
jgi:hypothetical protein